MTQNISSFTEPTKELYKAALLVREKSYSPYSHCKVGSAIRTSTGKIFTGCNVENASYGASVCAERTAIQKAVSEQGSLQITEIMVVTDVSPPWRPCGMCRQVIAEFASKDATVIMANVKGNFDRKPFTELFPDAFTPAHLKV